MTRSWWNASPFLCNDGWRKWEMTLRLPSEMSCEITMLLTLVPMIGSRHGEGPSTCYALHTENRENMSAITEFHMFVVRRDLEFLSLPRNFTNHQCYDTVSMCSLTVVLHGFDRLSAFHRPNWYYRGFDIKPWLPGETRTSIAQALKIDLFHN